MGIDSGRPVVRLDDLVVMLRNAFRGKGQFLCAITPLPENLERTQQYLADWDGRPVRPDRGIVVGADCVRPSGVSGSSSRELRPTLELHGC